MTMTGPEKEILSQIAADVSDIKVTVGKTDVRVAALQDTTLDHEARLRAVESKHTTLDTSLAELRSTSISRKGFTPLIASASALILAAGVIWNLFHSG